MIFSTNSPSDLPPTIAIAGEIWQFLGTAAENGIPWIRAAYYGVASGNGPGSRFLKIRLGDGAVTLTDCTAQTSATGSYS